MALTYTPHGNLGDACPDFALSSVDGRKTIFNRKDFNAKPWW